MNPIENFRSTSTVMEGLLDRVAQDEFALSTPCADWSVEDLVDHIVNNIYFFAGAAGVAKADAGVSIAADNAAGEYRIAVDLLLNAYADQLDTDLATPFGTFPGSMVLSVAFADQLTHVWDLSRALKVGVQVDDDLVAQAEAAWQAFIQPEARDGAMFVEAKTAPADASNLDRLAAFTGRTV